MKSWRLGLALLIRKSRCFMRSSVLSSMRSRKPAMPAFWSQTGRAGIFHQWPRMRKMLTIRDYYLFGTLRPLDISTGVAESEQR